MSRTHRRLRRNLERQAIQISTAARNCTCQPDIEHRTDQNGVRHIDIYHDNGCPAADTGPTIALIRGHDETPHQFAHRLRALLETLHPDH